MLAYLNSMPILRELIDKSGFRPHFALQFGLTLILPARVISLRVVTYTGICGDYSAHNPDCTVFKADVCWDC